MTVGVAFAASSEVTGFAGAESAGVVFAGAVFAMVCTVRNRPLPRPRVRLALDALLSAGGVVELVVELLDGLALVDAARFAVELVVDALPAVPAPNRRPNPLAKGFANTSATFAGVFADRRRLLPRLRFRPAEAFRDEGFADVAALRAAPVPPRRPRPLTPFLTPRLTPLLTPVDLPERPADLLDPAVVERFELSGLSLPRARLAVLVRRPVELVAPCAERFAEAPVDALLAAFGWRTARPAAATFAPSPRRPVGFPLVAAFAARPARVAATAALGLRSARPTLAAFAPRPRLPLGFPLVAALRVPPERLPTLLPPREPLAFAVRAAARPLLVSSDGSVRPRDVLGRLVLGDDPPRRREAALAAPERAPDRPVRARRRITTAATPPASAVAAVASRKTGDTTHARTAVATPSGGSTHAAARPMGTPSLLAVGDTVDVSETFPSTTVPETGEAVSSETTARVGNGVPGVSGGVSSVAFIRHSPYRPGRASAWPCRAAC